MQHQTTHISPNFLGMPIKLAGVNKLTELLGKYLAVFYYLDREFSLS